VKRFVPSAGRFGRWRWSGLGGGKEDGVSAWRLRLLPMQNIGYIASIGDVYLGHMAQILHHNVKIIDHQIGQGHTIDKHFWANVM
jgi:hypothetical protein